ncbi:aminoglycoside phosphotransferase family protein [Dactylosporangium sp. AC04546]|uniref:aminoglycoside phosphotransferase family protein n=1 Tax=Dactylosporangium sp. AC04546 TaxID=2862460 RepID=UPI001EDD5EB1|nr:aminoglycoside phosphotransferase family protein [Dactylosporangium sp. AC04546]WVK79828.1 aminoglycoside phosphotransferase family protein [Dactylosporangium sp. AC04546]
MTTPALVRRLLAAQHPDLDGPVHLVASGWDNDIYRLGPSLSVRLPRRVEAVSLMHNEQRWLPLLRPVLPVAVPDLVRLGAPSGDFPWPWSVNTWLPGAPATTVPVPARLAFAAQLASFLTALHVPAPAAAPRNPVRGVPLSTRTPAMSRRFATGRVPAVLRPLWNDLVLVPLWDGPPVWIHGDPHPANLLVGADGLLSGVVDFGDLAAGDPATDLAAAWLVFDAPARAVFRSGLDVDEATWERARGWALNIGASIAADVDPTPEMAAIADHVLREVQLP